jgi:hypothetical protein
MYLNLLTKLLSNKKVNLIPILLPWIRILIRPNDVDPCGSGSATLVRPLPFCGGGELPKLPPVWPNYNKKPKCTFPYSRYPNSNHFLTLVGLIIKLRKRDGLTRLGKPTDTSSIGLPNLVRLSL